MGISQVPIASAASKTPRIVTLNSGTSWTVPATVTTVNATLIGGGGGGQGTFTGPSTYAVTQCGLGGQIVTTIVATTPGAAITYAIGAAGAAGTSGGGAGGAGGTTTFTGATSATGGNGAVAYGAGATGLQGVIAGNHGNGGMSGGAAQTGGAGGAGQIVIEYWV
jgi:hypothetical protein